MASSNINKIYNQKDLLINNVKTMLLNQSYNNDSYNDSKNFLINNYSTKNVFSAIKFLKGEYTEKEENLFLTIYTNF
jgi:hypothetical protein